MSSDIVNEKFRQLALHAATSAVERMQQRYQQIPDQDQFHDRIHSARDTFVGIVPIVKQAVSYLFLGGFLLSISVATYGLFYVLVMPSHAATEQLYFDYTCQDLNTPNIYNKAANASQRQIPCSPIATVDIFSKHTNWDAFIEDIKPAPISDTNVLKVGRPYFLELRLQLPESQINKQIGMFGIKIELQTKERKVVAKSVRSARIPHESGWIANVRKFLLLPPLIVGALTESRIVNVPAFRHFVEHKDHPLHYVVVSLVSQGISWRSDTPIEVIDGQLRIGKELNLLQSILKEWFWTCLSFGTAFIFLSQGIMVLVGKIMLEAIRDAEEQRRQEEDLAEQPYAANDGELHSTDESPLNTETGWMPMSENANPEEVRQTPAVQNENNDETPDLNEE